MKTIDIKSLSNLRNSVQKLIDILEITNITDKSLCLAFYGEMGAGKTTIIKEICRLLKVKDVTSSPSFSLINEYITEDNRKIYHFDFYRINKYEEVFDLGYEEYFYNNNLCLVEWPEKMDQLLPRPYYKIEIQVVEQEERRLLLSKIE